MHFRTISKSLKFKTIGIYFRFFFLSCLLFLALSHLPAKEELNLKGMRAWAYLMFFVLGRQILRSLCDNNKMNIWNVCSVQCACYERLYIFDRVFPATVHLGICILIGSLGSKSFEWMYSKMFLKPLHFEIDWHIWLGTFSRDVAHDPEGAFVWSNTFFSPPYSFRS